MYVELLARFGNRRSKTEEEMDEDKINLLIDSSFTPSNNVLIEYEYDPIILDLVNIDEFLRFDGFHTQLNMKQGRLYIVKIPYKHFKEMFQQFTGTIITKAKFVEDVANVNVANVDDLKNEKISR